MRRGQGCCSTSYNVQNTLPPPPKRMTQSKCQQCQVQKPCGQPSSRLFWNICKGPFQSTEGTPQTPTPTSKTIPPQVSSDETVWRDGERRTEETSGGLVQRCSLHPPPIPERRNPRHGPSLVKQENVRLNSRGKPSTPPAQWPKSGQFLFAEKSMLTDRRQNLAPQEAGRKSGRDRQVAAWLMLPGWGGPHLFSIRVCTLYTRSRASFRICLVLCRSAISLKNLMMSVKSMLFSKMMSR